jgi:hypothetical protein
MTSILRALTIVSLALGVAGCGTAGRQFERIENESLVIGKTSTREITTRLGKPEERKEISVNGIKLDVLTYAYITAWSTTANGQTLRHYCQTFYFDQDRLVGHEYVSARPTESTDFDETLVGRIQEGKTTREEVEQMLGTLCGYRTYPFVEAGRLQAIYTYFHVSCGTPRIPYRKVLLLEYGTDSVVVKQSIVISGHK